MYLPQFNCPIRVRFGPERLIELTRHMHTTVRRELEQQFPVVERV